MPCSCHQESHFDSRPSSDGFSGISATMSTVPVRVSRLGHPAEGGCVVAPAVCGPAHAFPGHDQGGRRKLQCATSLAALAARVPRISAAFLCQRLPGAIRPARFSDGLSKVATEDSDRLPAARLGEARDRRRNRGKLDQPHPGWASYTDNGTQYVLVQDNVVYDALYIPLALISASFPPRLAGRAATRRARSAAWLWATGQVRR